MSAELGDKKIMPYVDDVITYSLKMKNTCP